MCGRSRPAAASLRPTGLARWKIENEDINRLKTKGYNVATATMSGSSQYEEGVDHD